ncbi:MAG: ABC-2 type transport system permease protein [Halobacteriales archaeon]|jgi:ABC-2 type transport system permease protein
MSPLGSGRPSTAFEMGLREYARTPVLLALLFFLPAYFVGIFVYVLPASEVPITVPGSGRTAVFTIEAYGVLLVPMMGALIGGLAGLFVMLTAREADGRLVVAGYRPIHLVVARYVLIALATLVAIGVSLAVLSIEFVPERIGWIVAASLLVGLIYGVLGTLSGLVLSRLAGVYTMLMLPMIDVFFFQNPLVEEYHWIAAYLPAHGVIKVATDAGFTEQVSLDPLLGSVGYFGLGALLATAAFYRSLRV